ncbi:MAG: T9SS type A sorting domain-containing protein [bacterium]
MRLKQFITAATLAVLAIFCTDIQAQIPDGAILWLRADTGVTSDNGTVSDWASQSTVLLKKSAYQQLPISRPSYRTDQINHLPVVHFDGRYNFLDCAPIFPARKDYTVSFVARVADVYRTNYFFGGNNHVIYTGGNPYTVVRNDTFPAPYLTSVIPLIASEPTIITVSYRQSNQTASLYIDGEFADSSRIGQNLDKQIYLGAFQANGSLNADLAEIVLYDSVLSKANRRKLEGYFFKKYDIPPPFAPDSIFTAIPRHLHFYQRGDDDYATAEISGTYPIDGYDSMYLKVFKNGVLQSRESHPLQYSDGKASFNFSPRIHAELSEYSFFLAVKSTIEDRRIAYRDSVVCGDAILIDGQSNSINNNLGYTNEFFRTFGLNQSAKPSDTAWAVTSVNVGFGGGTEAGSWATRLQELIMKNFRMPTCVINAGVSGTTIEQHLPDPLNKSNLFTFYGQMLYRVQKAKLGASAKMLFWYQGESNIITDYASNFQTLYQSWKQDFPGVKKIYSMQVHPGCSAGFASDVREFQRNLPEQYPDIQVVSTMAIPGHDGCHYDSAGYSQIGDNVFRLVAKDFYGSSDRDQIAAPNIKQAYYTDGAHTGIGLTFSPAETRFNFGADTTINGTIESLKYYFYVGDVGDVVESMSSIKNRIFLKLKQPLQGRVINYLPDNHYLHSVDIYEGPWLTNTRGIGALSFYHVPIVDSAQQRVGGVSTLLDFQIYPNPASSTATIHFNLSQAETVGIVVYDVLGRVLLRINENILSKGAHSSSLNTADLPDGEYFCRLQAGTQSLTQKIIVAH